MFIGMQSHSNSVDMYIYRALDEKIIKCGGRYQSQQSEGRISSQEIQGVEGMEAQVDGFN